MTSQISLKKTRPRFFYRRNSLWGSSNEWVNISNCCNRCWKNSTMTQRAIPSYSNKDFERLDWPILLWVKSLEIFPPSSSKQICGNHHYSWSSIIPTQLWRYVIQSPMRKVSPFISIQRFWIVYFKDQ